MHIIIPGFFATRSVPLPATETHPESPACPDYKYQPRNLIPTHHQPGRSSDYQVPQPATMANHIPLPTWPAYKYQPTNRIPVAHQDLVHRLGNDDHTAEYQLPPPVATLVNHNQPTACPPMRNNNLAGVAYIFVTYPEMIYHLFSGLSTQSSLILADSPPMDISDGESFPSSSEML